MSVYRRFEAEDLPSLVTTNTRDRRVIFTSTATCELLVRILYEGRARQGVLLLAFAIMPDHLHAILVTEKYTLAQTMQLVKGRFARAYNRRVGGTGPIWQSRYHERTLGNEAALFDGVEYVHNNPVMAGLASEAEECQWSSVHPRYDTDLLKYLGSG